MITEKLSYSAWSQYLKCPYAYKRKFINYEKTPTNEWAYYGIGVQKLFENFINQVVRTGKFGTDDENINWLFANLQSAFESHKDPLEDFNKQSVINNAYLGARIFYNLFNALKFFNPTTVSEHKIIKTYGDMKITGICDFICTKTHVILDAKGSKKSYYDKEATVEANQLLLYAYLYNEMYGIYPYIGFVFYHPNMSMVFDSPDKLDYQNRVVWLQYTKKDLDLLISKMYGTFKEINCDTKFEAKKNKYCGFCYFKNQCIEKKEEAFVL